MKFGLGNLGLRSAPSIPRRVAALLRRFNASLILPGEQTPVGLVNLLTYSNDFGSSWYKNYCSVTPGQPGVDGTASTKIVPIADAYTYKSIQRTNPVTVGGNYTAAFIAKAGEYQAMQFVATANVGRCSINLTTGANTVYGGSFAVSVQQYKDTDFKLVVINFPAASLFSYWIGAQESVADPAYSVANDGTSGIYLHSAALFQGTVTAQQIIDNGGIPVTTSYPRSISYSDTINGFRTGNWTDSVGSIPATIDGKTGLVIDAAGSVGPELVTLDFSGATASSSNQYAWAINSSGGVTLTGESSFTKAAQATGVVYSGLTANKTYRITLSCSLSVADTLQLRNGVQGADPLIVDFGTGTQFVNKTATFTAIGTSIYFRFVSAATSVEFTSIQVRELTGIHATQATDGFKPVERRGLVNQLLWSSDFSQSAWAKGAGIVPEVTGIAPLGGVETTFTSAGGTPAVTQTRTGGTGATTVTYAFLTKRAGTRLLTTWMVRNGTTSTNLNSAGFNTQTGVFSGVSSSAQVSGDWYLGCVTVSSGISATDTLILYAGSAGSNSPAGETYVVGSCALFTGTVTAQDIIDAGGIPVTTTEPKSSSLGPRYWQFDAIDDKLQMTFPTGAGWNSATIVQARKTGAVTLTGQNIEGTYYITGGGNKYGEIFVPGSLSASELALLQKFANDLSEYTGA